MAFVEVVARQIFPGIASRGTGYHIGELLISVGSFALLAIVGLPENSLASPCEDWAAEIRAQEQTRQDRRDSASAGCKHGLPEALNGCRNAYDPEKAHRDCVGAGNPSNEFCIPRVRDPISDRRKECEDIANSRVENCLNGPRMQLVKDEQYFADLRALYHEICGDSGPTSKPTCMGNQVLRYYDDVPACSRDKYSCWYCADPIPFESPDDMQESDDGGDPGDLADRPEGADRAPALDPTRSESRLECRRGCDEVESPCLLTFLDCIDSGPDEYPIVRAACDPMRRKCIAECKSACDLSH